MFKNKLNKLGVADLTKSSWSQSGREIVRAVVVIFNAAGLFVAIAIAGDDQPVVNAAGRVLDDCQNWTSAIGQRGVGTTVLLRHEFAQIAAVKSPGVDGLLAVGVDDVGALSAANERGLATEGRNDDWIRHGGVVRPLCHRSSGRAGGNWLP